MLARLLIDGDPYSGDAGHGAFFNGVALAAFCGVLGYRSEFVSSWAFRVVRSLQRPDVSRSDVQKPAVLWIAAARRFFGRSKNAQASVLLTH